MKNDIRLGKESCQINIIGAGNVATHLAYAFQSAGYLISGIFSREKIHAEHLASELHSAVATDRIEELPNANVYIFAVKDNAISALATRLSESMPNCESLIVHTAGSIPISILSTLFKNAAVLYPLQTLSKQRIISFSEIPLFVEASNKESLQQITELAHNISNSVTSLDSHRRSILHLSAVFACNFTNHCYAIATKILEEVNIDPKCLLPLIDETARKIHILQPNEAQTGPAVRWDTQIIEQQSEILSDKKVLQSIYNLMSISIHHLNSPQNKEKETLL